MPGMLHQRLRALDGRLGKRGQHVGRAAGRDNGPVQQLDLVRRHPLRTGVDVEDRRVPRGDQADGIVDDGGGRVGAGGDYAEDPVRRALDEGEAAVAGPGRRLQDFGPRRLVDDEQVLLDLVLDAAEPRFLLRHGRQQLGVAPHRLPHRCDDAEPLFERQLVEGCGIPGVRPPRQSPGPGRCRPCPRPWARLRCARPAQRRTGAAAGRRARGPGAARGAGSSSAGASRHAAVGPAPAGQSPRSARQSVFRPCLTIHLNRALLPAAREKLTAPPRLRDQR